MDYRYAARMEVVKPSAIRQLLNLGADPDIISFGGGYPDPDLFPIDKLKAVFERVLEDEGRQALQYAPTDGLPALRQKLADRMQRAGVSCGIEHVRILQGAQQGLDLAARMLLDEGDTVIVENPTFIGGTLAFNPCLPRYVTVPMDDDGMIIDEVERALEANPKAKLIYTVPEFHNPTGVTMSLERRQRLVELAHQYRVVIIEDSPYREIRFEGQALPALKSFDRDGLVIHLGSFSKILVPGMRLGWVVASEEIAGKMTLLKTAVDTQNSTLNMHAANKFMDLYDIDAHIETIRRSYRQKKDLMLEVIQETFPECVSHTNPQGGLFTWLTFPPHVDGAELMKRTLQEAKVAYVPGATFYANEQEPNHARVNYSCQSREKIVEGMTKLGHILKEVC